MKWYSHSQCHHLDLKEEHCGSLVDLAVVLPGEVSISFALEPNNPRLVFRIDEVTGHKGVIVFPWFHPRALEQFLAAQYIEPDASFRALKPYAYSVPFAITANESVPLGLIGALSESTELYHCFFSELVALDIAPQDIAGKAFLSDQHSVVVSVCSIGRDLPCLRNSIKSFELHSDIDQIPRRLVFASTEYTSRLEMDACAYDLPELRRRTVWVSGALKWLYDTCGLRLPRTAKFCRTGKRSPVRPSGLEPGPAWQPVQTIWKGFTVILMKASVVIL
jgi:hypothetical protein